VRIYDTRRRAIVDLDVGPVVTMYTCGITPYDAAHLGHAATYLTYDVLRRRLGDAGHEITCVRNVTDVDDDILRKARELGVHYLDLAAQEIARFDRDMAGLGVLPVSVEPRATSAIPQILSMIGRALEEGAAYEAGGAIYFRVASSPTFGEISHLGRDEMLVLAKENGGNPEDPNKHDPLDFVLWQPSLPDEPSWESRWGPGRPGWHIECSALALRELGETVDIHGGGRDLIFPHHECEAAQSAAVTHRPLARYWVHVGLLGLDGAKMSKSLGNLLFVSDLLERAPAGAVRLALLSHHYRGDWTWTEDDLDRGRRRLAAYAASTGGREGAGLLDDVRAALDEDLDAPGALEALDAAPRGTDLSRSLALLGVTL
jgi:L-cysteine:1D-myo-inositol 2-amino-2-deoxy-alpha-D-glucopyranoside ligase